MSNISATAILFSPLADNLFSTLKFQKISLSVSFFLIEIQNPPIFWTLHFELFLSYPDSDPRVWYPSIPCQSTCLHISCSPAILWLVVAFFLLGVENSRNRGHPDSGSYSAFRIPDSHSFRRCHPSSFCLLTLSVLALFLLEWSILLPISRQSGTGILCLSSEHFKQEAGSMKVSIEKFRTNMQGTIFWTQGGTSEETEGHTTLFTMISREEFYHQKKVRK